MSENKSCKKCGFSKINEYGICENCGYNINEEYVQDDLWIIKLME